MRTKTQVRFSNFELSRSIFKPFLMRILNRFSNFSYTDGNLTDENQ
jgi:hypothetical protein